MKILIQGLEKSQIVNLSIKEDTLAISSIKLLMKYLRSDNEKRITMLDLIDVNLCFTDAKYIMRHINSTSIHILDLSYNDYECGLPFIMCKKKFKTLERIILKGMPKISKTISRDNFRLISENIGYVHNGLIVVL
jgi:hypothetical protein